MVPMRYRRELALKTYETFLTKNPTTAFPTKTPTTSLLPLPDYKFKAADFPSMRINFDLNKVIISRAARDIPMAKGLISTEKVKNLAMDLNLHGTTAIEGPDLIRLLKDFPNLVNLRFVFGTGWTTRHGMTEALGKKVALPLVPFDSNLEDYRLIFDKSKEKLGANPSTT